MAMRRFSPFELDIRRRQLGVGSASLTYRESSGALTAVTQVSHAESPLSEQGE